MNSTLHQVLDINRLVNSVGTGTFIKYFHSFLELDRQQLIELFDTNNETWTENSKGQKASNGKRIFNENLEQEVLENIILRGNPNRIPNGLEILSKARELYIEYNPKSESQSENVNISLTEKKVLAKYRLQQSKYRKELLLYWEGCSITKCLNSSLLIASHIKPYSEAEDREKYDLDNGLILTPTFDKLFDRYLISFKDDGTIILSESLDNDDLRHLKITGEEVLRNEKITPNIRKYLEHHRQKFEQKENEVMNMKQI